MGKPWFCFFVSGEENQVFPDSHLWGVPLSGKTDKKSLGSNLTIGDYFTASEKFLSKNNFSILKKGLESVLKRTVLIGQIEKFVIFLEKHGAFYHPLKVQVLLDNGTICNFVLNGAVSKPGLSLIENEYKYICFLNNKFPNKYLPRVFGVGFIKINKKDQRGSKNKEDQEGRKEQIGFFLGEWFEGYKEFHVTEDNNKRQIVIWESDGSCQYISQTRAFPIYQEISRILTSFYDIETFDQIAPWHHAAGDFIVSLEDDNFLVKLITVRGYSALTEFDEQSGEQVNEQAVDKKIHILPSLLFFFLNLTIRMRLDRLNGTGSRVMLQEKFMPAIVNGFLNALKEKSMIYDYGDIKSSFVEFFRQFNTEQIMGLVETILESSHNDSLESAIIEEKMESHCRNLSLIFKNL